MPQATLTRSHDHQAIRVWIEPHDFVAKNGILLAFAVHYSDNTAEFFMLSKADAAPRKKSIFQRALTAVASMAGAKSGMDFFGRWGTKNAAIGAVGCGLLPFLANELAALYPRLEQRASYHYVDEEGRVRFDAPLSLAG